MDEQSRPALAALVIGPDYFRTLGLSTAWFHWSGVSVSLFAAEARNLGEDGFLGVVVQAVVDDREVIRAMLDVEHVALANAV
jgi:hypothetical protein